MHHKPDIKVREIQPKDVDGVVGIITRARLAPSLSAAALRQRVEYLLSNSANISLVAEIADGMIGCLLSSFNGFHVHISHFAVEEEWRRHGVGRMLEREMAARGKALGALGIIVDSWLTAAGFYYELGYAIPNVVFMTRGIDAT